MSPVTSRTYPKALFQSAAGKPRLDSSKHSPQINFCQTPLTTVRFSGNEQDFLAQAEPVIDLPRYKDNRQGSPNANTDKAFPMNDLMHAAAALDAKLITRRQQYAELEQIVPRFIRTFSRLANSSRGMKLFSRDVSDCLSAEQIAFKKEGKQELLTAELKFTLQKEKSLAFLLRQSFMPILRALQAAEVIMPYYSADSRYTETNIRVTIHISENSHHSYSFALNGIDKSAKGKLIKLLKKTFDQLEK